MKKILLTSLVIFVLLWGGYEMFYLYNINYRYEGETIPEFVIQPEESTLSILARLDSLGVIHNQGLSYDYVKHWGKATDTKAGAITIKHGVNLSQIMNAMIDSVRTRRVYIGEGRNIYQVVTLLISSGIISDVQRGLFIQRCIDRDVEGYLAEGWYYFRPNINVNNNFVYDEIIDEMTNRWVEVYGDLFIELLGTDNPAKEQIRFIMILASLAQKEYGVKAELPMITRLYLNRDKYNPQTVGRLQCDPTAIYSHFRRTWFGVPDGEGGYRPYGIISNGELKIKDPYNTYVIRGFPPGPICTPSREAIEAAFNPAEHDYLYMMSRFDGSGLHYFTKTYTEHLRMNKLAKQNQVEFEKAKQLAQAQKELEEVKVEKTSKTPLTIKQKLIKLFKKVIKRITRRVTIYF